MRGLRYFMAVGLVALALPVAAQVKSGPALSKDQPIEISADALDVHQEQHLAIFTGNVIATQGSTNLRAKTMTVHYRQGANAAPATATPAASAQGISKIEAQGGVVFATPTETAQGDYAVYNADADTIDLTGAGVTLTRGANVLKGQKLTYNMATGRSVLTSSAASAAGKPARVHGLFVPKSDQPK